MSPKTSHKRPGSIDEHSTSYFPDTTLAEERKHQMSSKRQKLNITRPGDGETNSTEQTPLAMKAPTPSPSSSNNKTTIPLLTSATNILATEAAALAHITTLYRTHPTYQNALLTAIQTLTQTQLTGNKLLITGVGKSAYIAQKLTATCKSLSLRCAFLHAGEALHGDLGDIYAGDAVLLITHSGTTPEILALMAHVPSTAKVLALTRHVSAETCGALAALRRDLVFLPAPVQVSEEESFGVAAPTTSTTVSLAVGDMVALSVAGEVWGEGVGAVFRRNHPGGAIGAESAARVQAEKGKGKGGLRGQRAEDADMDADGVGMLPSPGISESDDG